MVIGCGIRPQICLFVCLQCFVILFPTTNMGYPSRRKNVRTLGGPEQARGREHMERSFFPCHDLLVTALSAGTTSHRLCPPCVLMCLGISDSVFANVGAAESDVGEGVPWFSRVCPTQSLLQRPPRSGTSTAPHSQLIIAAPGTPPPPHPHPRPHCLHQSPRPPSGPGQALTLLLPLGFHAPSLGDRENRRRGKEDRGQHTACPIGSQPHDCVDAQAHCGRCQSNNLRHKLRENRQRENKDRQKDMFAEKLWWTQESGKVSGNKSRREDPQIPPSCQTSLPPTGTSVLSLRRGPH